MHALTDDAATAVLRALRIALAAFGGRFTLHELVSRGWASVTFSGARHRIAFSLDGEGAGAAADGLIGALGEADFDLRGHILADIALAGEERSADGVRITLEALTVEDS